MEATLTPLLRVAGVVQLIIGCANFVLPKLLGYRESLAGCTRIVRQIFWVHSVYIVGVVMAFGGLCLFLPAELLSGTPLSTFLVTLLAVFWAPRIGVQRHYDHEVKRRYPISNVLFSLAIAYLGLVLTFTAGFVWLR